MTMLRQTAAFRAPRAAVSRVAPEQSLWRRAHLVDEQAIPGIAGNSALRSW
jgi:hypothetical protein